MEKKAVKNNVINIYFLINELLLTKINPHLVLASFTFKAAFALGALAQSAGRSLEASWRCPSQFVLFLHVTPDRLMMKMSPSARRAPDLPGPHLHTQTLRPCLIFIH